MKSCLVLEGGAMRGIYTAGVIDALLKYNIKFDTIIGVSAGALFGINYKSKQPKRVINYTLEYLKDKNYLTFRSLIKTGEIMNKDLFFNKIVYDTHKFDFDEFNNNKTKFYCVVTNINTGKSEYINLYNLKNKNQMEYLRSSGSMPLVSKIIKIKNNKYLDGGMSDSIPIKYAEKEYDKIVVVTTRPFDYRKKKTFLLPYKIMYRKYPNFINTIKNRYKEYNNTVEYIIDKENKKEIIVIRPSVDLKVKRLEKNKNKITDLYNLGYNDTEEKIKEIKNYLKV